MRVNSPGASFTKEGAGAGAGCEAAGGAFNPCLTQSGMRIACVATESGSILGAGGWAFANIRSKSLAAITGSGEGEGGTGSEGGTGIGGSGMGDVANIWVNDGPLAASLGDVAFSVFLPNSSTGIRQFPALPKLSLRVVLVSLAATQSASPWVRDHGAVTTYGVPSFSPVS